MRHEQIDPRQVKGWSIGPWNADLTTAVGWATQGIDWPHQHRQMTEIYLVARGTATACVEREIIELAAGDILVVEPGEAHTFLVSSEDYWHFVVHTPALAPEHVRADHVGVSRERLGLT